MNTLTNEIQAVQIKPVVVTEDTLTVDLVDGRTVAVPLAWYPRLLYSTPEARRKWRLIGNGEGIHWPDLDEDISVENLLMGKPSGESQRSFKRWLEEYMAGIKQPESSKEEVVV
jgi:hypothetical protein